MGCCGKSTIHLAAPIPPEDWVLLEYIGTANDPITYQSPFTHERYRVALKHGKHLFYAHPTDVSWLTGIGHFKLATIEAEPDPEPTAKRSKK